MCGIGEASRIRAPGSIRQGTQARHKTVAPTAASACPPSARKILLLTCVITGGVPSAALAQQPVMEEIIVTGSRIARRDFESASPVVSIPHDAFERTSSTTVDTVMNRLPQFTSMNNNFEYGGQGHLQLRGLGTRSTLVLLDGRRLIPANGTGVVDTNIIPPALIDSVEIVTGGASAVYGSDAVAGVVNFKLKPAFNGLQFDGSWGQTDHSDGTEYSAGITGGLSFAEGRGEVFAYAGYSEREAVTFAERDFARYALSYFGPGAGGVGPDGGFLPSGSTLIEEGRPSALVASQEAFDTLFESYGYPAGTVPYQTFFGVNDDESLFTMGDRSPGTVVNFRGERDPILFNDRLYSFNFAPWNYLQLPLERISAFGRVNYEFGSGHEAFAQVLYADYTADLALAPTPANNLFVPVTNPYIPADLKYLLDSRANPAADLRVAKRFSELGPRIASNQYDVYQITTGLHGPLSERWQYDAYAQYGENEQRERQQGNALRSRINDLSYAPDGGESICGQFSLFPAGRMSADCLRYIAAEGTNRSGYEQSLIELSVTGPAVDLPAGELRLAVGVMHKRDEYFYRADPIASSILEDGIADIIGFNAADDIEGSDHNTDAYVEALVPLLSDRPGIERLEAGLGFRHSDYASAGGADAWKGELLYQPVEPLRLRGSLQHAVRAPSIFELYQPRLPTGYGIFPEFGGVADPCTAGSAERTGPNGAEVEALCLAQGVPAALLPDFFDQDLVHRGVQGGNPELDPETADTLTLGFVVNWSPQHFLQSRLQLSLDWYRIEVEDAIEYASATTYVPLCFDPRTNPSLSESSFWCSLFSRDSTSGEIVDLKDILVNIDGFEVSGVDVQLDWAFDLGAGSVSLNTLLSWLDRFEVVPPPGLTGIDKVGFVGNDTAGSVEIDVPGARPEWKWNVNLRYDWRAFTIGTQWRHIASMRDVNRELNYRIPSYDYVDLYATWAFESGILEGLTLRAGLENLSDEDPPLLPSWVGGNTDPAQYDVLGRRYYLNLSYAF